ncbi:MAG: MltA domain-containing protein [Burkholderiales bacterium]|nr:MltA domain-containing protein [Burkholderiales bacterium]
MVTPLCRRRIPTQLAAVLLVSGLLAGCQSVPPVPVPTPTPPPSPRVQFTPAAWADLPGWAADPVAAAWPAFVVGCRALLASPKTRPLWKGACAAGERIDGTDSDAVRAFFVSHFSPYRVAADDGNDAGLVTGYYEPMLAGSRARSAHFPVPIYAPPDDLLTVDLAQLYPELKGKRVRGRVEGKKVVPYWPRAELEHNPQRLAGKVLVYVADPIEAFFLEIQGSGRVELTDGSVLRLNYADQNGHPYRSIGRVLADRDELPLERTSMQGIRAWAQANPEKLRELLDQNPSYVFFREIPAPPAGTLDARIDGPLGALGVPLLAGRTIAVDPRSIPLGAPVFLATSMPLSDEPLTRLTLAQDTGGAIRGAVRADFFWGFGPAAGHEAGRMKQQGRMWLLWPKGAPLPKG